MEVIRPASPPEDFLQPYPLMMGQGPYQMTSSELEMQEWRMREEQLAYERNAALMGNMNFDMYTNEQLQYWQRRRSQMNENGMCDYNVPPYYSERRFQ